jgi:hypothetical protein
MKYFNYKLIFLRKPLVKGCQLWKGPIKGGTDENVRAINPSGPHSG